MTPTARGHDASASAPIDPRSAVARHWRWITPLLVAAIVWWCPHAGFSARAWGLLSLYASVVSALITRPMPSGAVLLIASSTALFLGLFSVQEALSGYANVTVWLIVAAFLFSRAFVKTRLGERIAYAIVEHVGRSPLRLGYALVLADLAMAPMTPSNTARAGGILFPITLNVARAFGSEPGPTAPRIGAYLMKTLYQGDLVVSAMFLTATAPNPLVAELAREASGVRLSWTVWAAAAIVPGLIAVAVVPYLVFRLCPPELRDTSAARSLAAERLQSMGPMAARERALLGIFAVVLILWLAGEWLGISATAVAYGGLSLLLLTRVLDWQDLLDEKGAWDALVWFGGLVMFAGQFEKAGFPKAFAQTAAAFVTGWPWWWALAALVVLYVYAHYAFASLVAHVTAMFPAFFAVAIGLGAPPRLAALAFGVFSSLDAATTHYGTGPAPIIFGSGYLGQRQWWRIGFILSIVHLALWLPVGFLWWKVIGLW